MKIVPIKYLLFLNLFCLIIAPLLFYVAVFVVYFIFTFGTATAPWYVVLMGLFLGVVTEIKFLVKPKYCELIIKDGTVANYIFDGTPYHGWCEEISNIRKIVLVGKKDVQKFYKLYNKGKAILIDFGNNNVKYICAVWFSKRQIKKIMDLLRNRKTS